MFESTNAKISKKGYTKDRINPLNALALLSEKDYSQYNENELIKIYNDYLVITKRVRSMTCSKGLKKKFGVTEVSDNEILTDTSKLKYRMITILEMLWKIIVQKELRGDLLNRYEFAYKNELNYKKFVLWVAEKTGKSVSYDMNGVLYISGIDKKEQKTKRKEVYRRKRHENRDSTKEQVIENRNKNIELFNYGINGFKLKQLFSLNDQTMNKIAKAKDIASLLNYSVGHASRLLTVVRTEKKKKRVTVGEFLKYHHIEIEVN
jgi:hypothetical protein